MRPLTVHTYRAAEPGLQVNSYLIEGESGILVIDSNLLVSDIEALRARLAALKKPLLGVAITHAHPDHLVTAICHGTALLRCTTLSGGDPLVRGKTVTGFANVEEDFSDQAMWDMGAMSKDQHVMPWRIEDELRSLGANFIQAGQWIGFAVRDGNLITGQQNFSGGEFAALLVDTLGR